MCVSEASVQNHPHKEREILPAPVAVPLLCPARWSWSKNIANPDRRCTQKGRSPASPLQPVQRYASYSSPRYEPQWQQDLQRAGRKRSAAVLRRWSPGLRSNSSCRLSGVPHRFPFPEDSRMRSQGIANPAGQTAWYAPWPKWFPERRNVRTMECSHTLTRNWARPNCHNRK